MKEMKTTGRNENMKRTRWAFLFRMIMGLALAGALLAPAAGLAAGPYVAKAATEETDWISPVYDLLEEEMELPLSADWKTSGWTVEGDGDSTEMLFSYPAEGSGAFLGNYRTEYKAAAGSMGSGQATEALERHLVPALNFIRMMRLTLEYKLAMSDDAVNGYFSDRYSVRVPVFYSGKDENVRVDVLPFYFVPRDEKGELLTDYSRQSADGMVYLYLIRTEEQPDGRCGITETLVADQELLGKIFPMVFEQMDLPELSDWLLRTPEKWRSEHYFGEKVSAAALLGQWETEFGYNADLRTLEEPRYPMSLELNADGTCLLTRDGSHEGTWNLEDNTLRVDYDKDRYLLFDAMDRHLYLTVVAEDKRILSVHRLRREAGEEQAFSINLGTAEPPEETEEPAPAEDGPVSETDEPKDAAPTEELPDGLPEVVPTVEPPKNALTVLSEDNVTILSAGQRLPLTVLDASGAQVSQGITWTVTDLGGFDGRSYATVNRNGIVTAKTLNRKVQIRVKASMGSDARGEIELTILPRLRRMSLDKTKFVLYVGAESETLQVSANPAEAMPPELEWTAADDLVTLEPSEDGTSVRVTAKKAGKTSVTVKDARSRASASARITVLQPVTGLTVSGPEKVQRGKSATYHVSLMPTNASDKTVTWSVDTQNSVAVVSSDGTLKVRKAAEPGLIIHLTCTAKGAGEPITQTIEVKVE